MSRGTSIRNDVFIFACYNRNQNYFQIVTGILFDGNGIKSKL